MYPRCLIRFLCVRVLRVPKPSQAYELPYLSFTGAHLAPSLRC